jgi:hypothetical protein
MYCDDFGPIGSPNSSGIRDLLFFSREVGIRTPPTPLPYWTILIFSELNFSRKELDLIGMFQNVFLMETKIKYMQTDPLVDLD